jgi:hypothetical protein
MKLSELKKEHNNMISTNNGLYGRILLMNKVNNITKNNVSLLQTSYTYYLSIVKNACNITYKIYKEKSNTLPKMLKTYYNKLYIVYNALSEMQTMYQTICSLLQQAYTVILLASSSNAIMKSYANAYITMISSQINSVISNIKGKNSIMFSNSTMSNNLFNEVIN